MSLAGEEVQTFLIADIREYTKFTHEQGDEAAARLIRVFAALAREAVMGAGGTLSELRGDEALAVFRSPRSALRAAVNLRARAESHTSANPHLPLLIGMGVDAGEGVPVEGGIRTGALNLASRLCDLARAGEILASEGVVHLARRVEGLYFGDCGEVTLKGIDRPVQVFMIWPEDGEVPRTRRLERPKGNPNSEAAMTVGLVGGGFGLAGTLMDRLVNSSANSIVIAIGIGLAVIAMLGASRVRGGSDRGSLVMIAAAIGLVLATGWWSIPAGVLLFIAGAMTIVQRGT